MSVSSAPTQTEASGKGSGNTDRGVHGPRLSPLGWPSKDSGGTPDPTGPQIAELYMPEFAAFQELVREMEIKAIAIQDCTILAVFEIYAAVNLGTPYNYFCTH